MGRTVNVAVLFTDLVGSTALASRVGPDRAEQLRVEHFSLLRAAIDEVGGEEVKNLGDGLMVVFASASAACSCAVSMQQAFDVRNRSDDGSARLEIRIGIAAGEADSEDDDYFGPPVVEAARLCAIADGGQILATQMARLIAGSRGGHKYASLGERELKGLPDPVEVVEVGWEPLTDAERTGFSVPLPARLTPATGTVFVGRTRELERAEDAWKSVLESQRRVLMVAGEAGIGKTTLVSRIASRVHGAGGVVVYGRCDEDLGVPYQPWIEALTTLVDRLPGDALTEHVAARGGELARLVPAVARRTSAEPARTDDPDAERYALLGAVTDLLGRASSRVPLLLVLDDLHWADAPTVSLLRHLATQSDPLRVHVIATYRQTDLGAHHPLTAAMAPLHREPCVEFVDLAGLANTELLELMEAFAGHPMDADGLAVRDMIAAETGGNAFFASEVLRHLASTGAIEYREGRWVPTVDFMDRGLPVSVREVVAQRVARLGPDTEGLLRHAAVIGRDFDLEIVATVAHMDEDDALHLLDGAAAAAVVDNVGGDRYTFVHALVAQVLYEDLSPARRGRAHRRVAEALETQLGEESDDRIAELARHWAAATAPEDTSKAVDSARRAGDRALAQLAPDEALRWYRQALDLATAETDAATLVRLTIGVGIAQGQIGEAQYRETLLDAARRAHEIGSTELLVTATLANHRGISSLAGETDHERIKLLELALDAVGPNDSTNRARLLAVLSTELTFHPDRDRRRRLMDEAIAIARRVGDPPTLLAALRGRMAQADYSDCTAATRNEICAGTDEMLDLAERIGDHAGLAHAAASAANTVLLYGDRRRYDRAVRLCRDAAERVGQPLLRFRAAAVCAIAALVDGRLAEAETITEELLAIGSESGQPDVLMWYLPVLSTIRFHQGRGIELRDLHRQIAEDPTANAVVRLVAGLAMSAGSVQAGDLDALREDLARIGAVASDIYFFHILQMCLAAHANARLGDRESAAVLLEVLRPFRGMIECASVTNVYVTSTCMGMLAALLGRDAEADEHFAEAIAVTSSFGAPYHLAFAQVEWSRVLLERPAMDEERVRTLLTDALDAGRAHGFGAVERDATALLSRIG